LAEPELRIQCSGVDATRALDGRGLMLRPSAFISPYVAASLNETRPAELTYPARGLASLFFSGPERQDAALATLLGSTRAHVLEVLEDPMHTSGSPGFLDVPPETSRIISRRFAKAVSSIEHASDDMSSTGEPNWVTRS
jgi:hypothetical protein